MPENKSTVHNIKAKGTLKYGRVKERDIKRQGATQIGFLRLLLSTGLQD